MRSKEILFLWRAISLRRYFLINFKIKYVVQAYLLTYISIQLIQMTYLLLFRFFNTRRMYPSNYQFDSRKNYLNLFFWRCRVFIIFCLYMQKASTLGTQNCKTTNIYRYAYSNDGYYHDDNIVQLHFKLIHMTFKIKIQ